MSDLLLQAAPLAVLASVPLLFAVLGELVVQRAGMINLGLEGMLLTAALAATVAAQVSGSPAIGILGGIAGAAAIGLVYGAFVIGRKADQIVTGTALNLLALGGTAFAYRELQQTSLAARPVPAMGGAAMAVLAWIVIPLALALLLGMTRFGLRLRACGENPEAVGASGGSVATTRWTALAMECVLAGAGGADLALSLSSGFAENMSAGRGFIALSIVIFARWSAAGVVAGTALFGVTAALQYALQAASRGVQFHLLLALPYVVTLLILCGIAGKVRAPERLGRN